MAKCKTCKKNIADDVEYCDDCLNENLIKDNEDYLDSLLNSVRYPEKEAQEEINQPDQLEEPQESEEDFDINNIIMEEIQELLQEGTENQEDENEEITLEADSLEDDADTDFSTLITDDNVDDNKEDSFEETEEDDLSSLLRQMNSDDPIASEIKEINNILTGEETEDPVDSDYPIDIGDIFADALSAVESLDDEVSEEVIVAKEEEVPSPPKEKKDSFIKRIFGNVEETKSEKALADKVEKKKQKKEQEKEQKKEEQKKEEKKKKKEKRQEEKKQRQEEKKKEKEEKRKKKEEQRKKVAIEVLEEVEDEGRINPIGSSLVFVFFGIVLIVILIGTNVFTYSLNIKRAGNYFNQNKYTEAYNQVYGVELNDSDIELYDKIMTVMFVNKQLSSYNSYFAMEKYPEALDSLLKGLQRYDKYLEFATIIGVMSDLDYVKTQILHELDNVFELSEEEAYRIINSENQMEYSIRVYDVILENAIYDSL